MPARTLPNLGLQAFLTLGEDNWKDEMDLNLLKLSVLTQGTVDSIVSDTPGSPTDGDVHIFSTAHPTLPNRIAIRDAGAWVYIVPEDGWMMHVTSTGDFYKFKNSVPAWQVFLPGGAGTSWQLINTNVISVPVAQVDFVGLSAYTDLKVIMSLLTASASGVRQLQVSTDNGSSFYSASGDYQAIANDGTVTNVTSIAEHGTASAAARNLVADLAGVSVANAPKMSVFSGSTAIRQFIADNANNIDAVRIRNSAGNLTGGTIYLLGR